MVKYSMTSGRMVSEKRSRDQARELCPEALGECAMFHLAVCIFREFNLPGTELPPTLSNPTVCGVSCIGIHWVHRAPWRAQREHERGCGRTGFETPLELLRAAYIRWKNEKGKIKAASKRSEGGGNDVMRKRGHTHVIEKRTGRPLKTMVGREFLRTLCQGLCLACKPSSHAFWQAFPKRFWWGSTFGRTKCGTTDISAFQNFEY